jgi:hypothetical protein
MNNEYEFAGMGKAAPDGLSSFDDSTIVLDPPILWDPPKYVDPVFTGTNDIGPGPIPPVKDMNQGNYSKSVTYEGQVYSQQTGEAIPNASIYLYAGGVKIAGAVADRGGNFSITITQEAETIIISSVGYKTLTLPARDWQRNFALDVDPKELDPLIVHGDKKNNLLWLLAAVALVVTIAKDQHKKMGKINAEHITLLGMAVAGVTGFSIIKKVLEGLGIWESKDTKDLDNVATNPYSPWSPNFWKQGPANTLILTEAGANEKIATLANCFGFFNDNEEGAKAVFTNFKTQSQLSYFSEKFEAAMKQDLLKWLRGGWWPEDRLSDADVNEINQYILRLPKYKP